LKQLKHLKQPCRGDSVASSEWRWEDKKAGGGALARCSTPPCYGRGGASGQRFKSGFEDGCGRSSDSRGKSEQTFFSNARWVRLCGWYCWLLGRTGGLRGPPSVRTKRTAHSIFVPTNMQYNVVSIFRHMHPIQPNTSFSNLPSLLARQKNMDLRVTHATIFTRQLSRVPTKQVHGRLLLCIT
jgi:hypothetical protein